MTSGRPVIAVTMGDPAGSGPETVLKALTRASLLSRARLVLIGDLGVFRRASETVGTKGLHFSGIDELADFREELATVNVVDLRNVSSEALIYGRPSVMGGKAAYECVVRAVDYALHGSVHAVVTAPISKESLNMAGYNYPGHTELLAELTGAKDVKMMLTAGHFRVVHVTTHVSMREAVELIKMPRILETLELSHGSLRDMFGIDVPRVAVAGLNPHSGEGGLFGDEEIKEIAPAIAEARRKGMNVLGPYPPDTVFYRAHHNREFDTVIAMYHDQGHIAMKMVGLMEGVNVTLGLPIIRVSPDHGTVWGKAGKGTADENATTEAMKLAIELATKKYRLET